MKLKNSYLLISTLTLSLFLNACASKTEDSVAKLATASSDQNEESEALQDVFTEYAARCVAEGHDLETSRIYSLHLDSQNSKAILIAMDTDKLTEVTYGDFSKSENTIVFKKANATFTKAIDDAGGEAIIHGEKFICDFSQ